MSDSFVVRGCRRVNEESSQHQDPVDRVLEKVAGFIKELQQNHPQTSDPSLLLEKGKSLLRQAASYHHSSTQVYSSLLSLILYTIVNYLPTNDGSDMDEQLLDLIQRLQPPLPDDDLDLIFHTLMNVCDQLGRNGYLSLEQVSMVVNPLVMEFSSLDKMRQIALQQQQTAERNLRAQKAAKTADDADRKANDDDDGGLSFRSRRYLRDTNKIGYDVLDAMSFGNEGNVYRGDIKTLQQEFIQQLRRAVSQVAQFSKQLESEIAFMHSVDPRNDVEAFKHSVIEMLHSLRHGHEAIALNFDGAKSYLKIIESGSQQLMDELDRVRVLSLTDELTGLPNRRAFLRRVNTEVDRISRYKHPLSLVIIDLDYFKRINDRFGHAVGDQALQTYADSVFPLFRNHDLVARYGGEEFVILFPDTDIEGVKLALQKIREKCRSIKIDVSEGSIALPGFSAGVAQYIDGESAETFIERADKVLYRAKQNGRGRTEIANYMEEPVETE